MNFKRGYDTGSSKADGTDNGDQELHDAAVKAVINQHGRHADRNPNYDDLVEDAKRQIQQTVEANKSF